MEVLSFDQWLNRKEVAMIHVSHEQLVELQNEYMEYLEEARENNSDN